MLVFTQAGESYQFFIPSGNFLEKEHHMKPIQIRFLILWVLSFFVLAGCAAVKSNEAQSTEELLVAAGFVMVPADTPEEIANLNTLTPLKVEFSVKDNKPLYWYADPYNCKCVYTGDQAAYQRYEKLNVEQNIANEEQEAAFMNENAMLDANMWGWMGGPWGW